MSIVETVREVFGRPASLTCELSLIAQRWGSWLRDIGPCIDDVSALRPRHLHLQGKQTSRQRSNLSKTSIGCSISHLLQQTQNISSWVPCSRCLCWLYPVCQRYVNRVPAHTVSMPLTRCLSYSRSAPHVVVQLHALRYAAHAGNLRAGSSSLEPIHSLGTY